MVDYVAPTIVNKAPPGLGPTLLNPALQAIQAAHTRLSALESATAGQYTSPGFVEAVQDIVAAMLVPGGSNVEIVYNDTTGQVTITVSGSAPDGGFGATAFGTGPFGGSAVSSLSDDREGGP